MAGAFAAEHQSALADVMAAGSAVSFAITAGGSYDPLTDVTTGAATVTVAGYAMRVKGDPLKYQALSLVQSEAPTLLFVPTVYGELPALDAMLAFGGLAYVVKDVDPLAPDGSAILARVIVMGAGETPIPAPPILDQPGWLL